MSFGSTALRIATVALLHLERIKFPYRKDMVKIWYRRILEKLDFKHRRAVLDLDFLIPCRNINVIPKFLYSKYQTNNCRHHLLTSHVKNV